MADKLDDKLQELVSDDVPAFAQPGLYVILGVTIAFLVLLSAVAVFLNNQSRKLETLAQETVTQTMTRSIERRFNMLTSQLQRVLAPSTEPFSCGRFEVMFNNHYEFVELAFVDETYNVTPVCLSHTLPTRLPFGFGEKINDHASFNALGRALNLRTSTFSQPYRNNGRGPFYVDIFIPVEGNAAYVASISIRRLINEVSDARYDYKYKIGLVIDGEEFTSDANRATPAAVDTIRVETPLPPLPPSVHFVTVNTSDRSGYTQSVQVTSLLLVVALLVLCFFWSLRSQFRQAETESKLRARLIVQFALGQSIIDGLCVTDSRGKILYANPAFARLFGLKPEDVPGLVPPYPFCPDETVFDFAGMRSSVPHRFSLHRAFEAVCALPANTTARTFAADGSPVPAPSTTFDCEVEIVPLETTARGGRQTGWLMTFRDVTEQNRARQAILSAHERSLRVLDSMNVSLSVLGAADPDGELLFANRLYLDTFGQGAQAHVRLKALLLADDPQTAAGEVYDEQTQCWFLLNLRTITWIDGKTVEMLTGRDITERKNNQAMLELQLKKAEQSSYLVAKGEMASSLAHELNQPLAAVQNYASAALTMSASGRLTREDMLTALNKIINQTQRAAQIIKRIRGFSKRNETMMARTAVARLIDETKELALLQSKKLGVGLVIDNRTPRETEVVCDSVMIVQVLINLLKNAMEATVQALPDPRRRSAASLVRFEIVGEAGFIAFYVHDRGCGIDPADAAHVFDPFFTTKETGMGIGLNICRSIVETHHGRLSFEARAGGGTTFKMTIPSAPIV